MFMECRNAGDEGCSVCSFRDPFTHLQFIQDIGGHLNCAYAHWQNQLVRSSFFLKDPSSDPP